MKLGKIDTQVLTKSLKKKIKKILIILVIVLLVLVMLWALIPMMVMDAIKDMLDIDVFEQECPELVRAFLMENYEEFESKIRTLCNDSSFMSYVADSQFDSAYTKMVYGGTSSYTEDELIGNYKGTQGEKSTFITKNSNGAYTANSMLDNVTYYQNKGVSLDKIYVNDEYISGYSSSGIMKSKEKQPDNFKTWLKASYYNTAFYFWYSTGFNDARNDADYASFRDYKDNSYNCYNYLYLYTDDANKPNSYTEKRFKNMKTYHVIKNYSYYDLLKDITLKTEIYGVFDKKKYSLLESTKFENPILSGPIANKIKNNDDSYFQRFMQHNFNQAIGISYVMVGDKILNNDGEMKGSISKNSAEATGLAKFIEKNSSKKKITGMLSNLSNSEIDRFSKRDSVNNKYVNEWKDNFAEYLSKELYYEYPDRDYIVSYFLSDSVSNEDKITFMSRSLNAMATGKSLKYKAKESYSIKDGKVFNGLTGKVVGDLDIRNIKFEKVKPIGVYGNLESNENGGSHVKEVSNWKNLKKVLNEILSDKGTLLDNYSAIQIKYKAQLKITDKNGKEYVFNDAMVSMNLNSGKYSIELADAYDEINSNEDIKKIFTWDKDFYTNNIKTSEGKKSLESANYKCGDNKIEIDSKFGNSIEKYDPKQVEKMINEINLNITKNKKSSLFSLFDGKLNLKGRIISLNYSDYSCFNYEKSIEYDNSGSKSASHIKKITYNIYTHFADTSKYDDESANYRIAYGFETDRAVEEAFKLLDYVKERKKNNSKNPLEGVRNVVDFDQLFIKTGGENLSNEYTSITENEDGLIEVIRKIIWNAETSGSMLGYSSYTEPYANTQYETAITVGYLQWYGNEARNVLGKICLWYPKKAKTTLGIDLYNEIVGDYKKNASWSNKRVFNASNYKNKIKTLLGSEEGKKGQDRFAVEQIKGYIKQAREKYGITNYKLIAYFIDMNHQSPRSALLVLNATATHFGGKKKMNSSGDVALDYMHARATDSSLCAGGYRNVLYSYISRREKTYKACKKIEDCESVISAAGNDECKKAVKYGISKLGYPYSMKNRTSENSFDCSSFVWHAWKSVGVSVSAKGVGDTAAILKWCESKAYKVCSGSVDTKKLQPGDILFYNGNKSKYKNVNHVSLYAGNRYILEASSAKGKVIKKKVSNSNGPGSSFFVAYRVNLSTSQFTWPVPGHTKISSGYGKRIDPFSHTVSYHNGLDFPAPRGTKIVAAAEGTVAWANYSNTAGNWIGINHGGNMYTVYMHQSRFAKGIRVGKKVHKGELIGYVGTTGSSTGNHLHFEIRMGGAGGTERKDPSPYLGIN